jgi:cysteinyl-tRNA synthetase
MSLKYLGNTLDIHGGGQDLIFPHHQNEIAQSESFTGKKPFVKYWLHNGLVQLGEDKMSKSLGNLITIKQALEKYSPDAIRLFVLSSHYHSPLTYSEEGLGAARGGAERLLRVISRDDTSGGKGEILDAESYRQRFIEAMDDDFNTPQALGTLFDLARKINEAGDAGIGLANAQNTLVSLAREVLGLKLPEAQRISVGGGTVKSSGRLGIRLIISEAVSARVTRLVEERVKCRQEKDWQRADEIRNRLVELGVVLEDTKTGMDVTYKQFPPEEALDNLMEELGIALGDSPHKS